MTGVRVRLARLVTRLASRIFVPLCPGGCRQPVTRCACTWLPPLPDELRPPRDEE